METSEISVVETPQIILIWDEKKQALGYTIKGVKTNEFALAMLEMARIQLQFVRDMAAGAQVQMQMQQMQQDMAIANRLKNGGIR